MATREEQLGNYVGASTLARLALAALRDLGQPDVAEKVVQEAIAEATRVGFEGAGDLDLDRVHEVARLQIIALQGVEGTMASLFPKPRN